MSDHSLGDERTRHVGAGRERPDVQPGARFGDRYEVVALLGRGGMGSVYHCRDRRLDRDVAIKRIHASGEGGAQGLARFRREARAVAALNHRNIVIVHEFDEDPEGAYIVMELLRGEDLATRVGRDGALSVDRVIDTARQVGAALSYAHRRGIVHRDIKPSNLLRKRDGTIKVLDFGLARVGTESQLSREGFGMGTLDYVSPEQRRDASRVDHRSDLFSLGATLYFLAAGRSPRTVRERDVPDALRDVVMRLMEERPEDRYFSVDEALFSLEARRDTRGVPPVPGSEPAPKGACAECGMRNTSDARFCAGCGQSLATRCARCGAEGPAGVRFCSQCGAPLHEDAPNEVPDSEAEKPETPQPPAPEALEPEPPDDEEGLPVVPPVDLPLIEPVDLPVVAPTIAAEPTPDLTFDASYEDVTLEHFERLVTGPAWQASDPKRNAKGFLQAVHDLTGLTFVLIPGGSFRMGSDDGFPDESPAHIVTLSRAFLLCTTPCTQEAWDRVGGDDARCWSDACRPIEGVSWWDAKAWCERAGLRLPTEAEWEYACRAGSAADYAFGDDPTELTSYAWVSDNADEETHEVAAKLANGAGLFDVHGNVWEWCACGYAPYSAQPVVDPAEPDRASGARMCRGGSWVLPARHARSSHRNWYDAVCRGRALGFRPACSLAAY